MDDLKPCPFCGGDARLSPSVSAESHRTVCCDSCGFSMSEFYMDDCIASWNTRTTPTVQEAAKVLLDNTPNPTFNILKPILMSEHSVTFPEFDEDGEEYMREINVPWVAMKRIISHALRALSEEPQ